MKEYVIGSQGAGQRLDRWLRRQCAGLPQSRIERMCRKGQLRLDGKRTRPSTRLQEGQAICMPEITQRVASRSTPSVSPRDAELLRQSIIYRDDHLIAINKPPGLASQGGSGVSRSIDGMIAVLDEGAERPRLVHRLDMDTSGLLLLAASLPAARGLSTAFKSHGLTKVYWAVIAGVPQAKCGIVRHALIAQSDRFGGVRCATSENRSGALPATTMYRVSATLGKELSAVALMPLTGRKHQLRVHMASMQCPIVGDARYGHRDTNLPDGFPDGLQLHARGMVFSHPANGRTMRLDAPPPDHMEKAFSMCGWTQEMMIDAERDMLGMSRRGNQ